MAQDPLDDCENRCFLNDCCDESCDQLVDGCPPGCEADCPDLCDACGGAPE
jgi:hypothetical protein